MGAEDFPGCLLLHVCNIYIKCPNNCLIIYLVIGFEVQSYLRILIYYLLASTVTKSAVSLITVLLQVICQCHTVAFKISLSATSRIQYSIINCSHYAVHQIPRTYLLYNWVFVQFVPFTHFCPSPSSLPSGNCQFVPGVYRSDSDFVCLFIWFFFFFYST